MLLLIRALTSINLGCGCVIASRLTYGCDYLSVCTVECILHEWVWLPLDLVSSTGEFFVPVRLVSFAEVIL